MRVEQQAAWVLHERPYRESSVLLEAFSREFGRVGLVARGARCERPRFGRGILKPLQPLGLGWTGRGELGTLTAAEAAGAPLVLHGEAVYAALYLNELLVRLLQRNDPHPEIFARYGDCLAELEAGTGAIAWTLRRFERDFLGMLGYAVMFAHEGVAGELILPDREYSYDPECGPIPWRLRPMAPSLKGRALLALGESAQPDEAVLRDLRRLMRAQIRHHLGGRELNAWRLFSSLAGPVHAAGESTQQR